MATVIATGMDIAPDYDGPRPASGPAPKLVLKLAMAHGAGVQRRMVSILSLKQAKKMLVLASTLASMLASMLAFLPGSIALAQRDGFPPGDIPGARSSTGNPAALLVRIDRLESRVRSMTGQIEQLQFNMRRMQKQLEAFQKDVDFRFKDQPGKSGTARRKNRRSDSDTRGGNDSPSRTAGLPTGKEPSDRASQPDAREPASSARRSDAFDPAANPNAPGAPRQLGSLANRPSTPLSGRPLPGGPLNRQNQNSQDRDRGLPAPDSPTVLSRPLPATPGTSGARAPSLVAAPDASPKQTYRIALAALRKRQYNDAETGFNAFLKRFPNSSLTPSVRYNLGTIYASRSRHREAAEQFLKVSTEHRKSSRAPDSLYRLGLSLERLGAREQACASYAEVERRYPLAPGTLRVRVERQMQKAKC